MTGKRAAKREALRENLIKAAIKRVQSDGMAGVNARVITQDAGCALGSLYTAFEDLDDLIIHMNSQTLFALGEAVQNAAESKSDPVEKLKALARAYVKFAKDNYALWIALFDYSALTGAQIPQWHQNEQEVLIRYIAGPVTALSSHLDAEGVGLRARTLFSAVHGIIALSLEDRYIGVPRDQLEDELMSFIDQMVAGLDR